MSYDHDSLYSAVLFPLLIGTTARHVSGLPVR
ncbi:hypothetical protein C8N33_10376 [Pararhodobacter aggregans]|nr:hypothetical protein C8N33_10376 [Pararhodobacter aggregans]